MAEYIERETAISNLMQMVVDHSTDKFNGQLLHYTGIKAMLEYIPSADVQPVKHGEWKHVQWVKDDEEQDGGYWISRCSNCIMPYHSETPYCPHCGARMDGVENV